MGYHRITLTVNGTAEVVDVPSNMTLLQMLRDKLGLTGTKNGCSAGEWPSCSAMYSRTIASVMVPEVTAKYPRAHR